MSDLGLFMAVAPGLEKALAEEALEKGFADVRAVPGGVEARGDWAEVWRANLEMRGAARVLVRVGEFRAFHLAQLDKRARKFPWGEVLRAEMPVRVEVTCKRSKIYHAGAAAQRIEKAISEELGAEISKEARIAVKVRIDDNLVVISLDSSGEALHKRGLKLAVGKAPMRENLAGLFLGQAAYRADMPVVDPMCGSGTFPIEAAEIALGMQPGRARRFAFEEFASFDAARFGEMRREGPARETGLRFYGYDRDSGAIKGAGENAARAGVGEICSFACQPLSDLQPPEGAPGLVMVNPPYGARIGNRKLLFGLYGSLGTVLKERFKGWRVGLVTSDGGLAKACDLPFEAGDTVAHGGLKVRLYRCGPLGR
ncbi:THUMP domain-containing class I SAM-dependent RNA methyltransferase [Rhodalgimonas zhirmunskyi]|uniref:Class I SAM-dependent RNA methyltransferase n=1 Tax=Rhodalgimonas zhirmunskyi TaxID=2964767 RepID=A0AAJ1UFA0_9RHOB|nr:class I SAM-dependent RNA methyltransferase [Rhodoalgimonas zhirmunskyi]MDQ2095186.1 class I SAM-dependent RNA methyltransferase [Rhodoalgimonas zhirmunskyi]